MSINKCAFNFLLFSLVFSADSKLSMIPNVLVFSKTCDEKQKKIKYTLICGHEYMILVTSEVHSNLYRMELFFFSSFFTNQNLTPILCYVHYGHVTKISRDDGLLLEPITELSGNHYLDRLCASKICMFIMPSSGR